MSEEDLDDYKMELETELRSGTGSLYVNQGNGALHSEWLLGSDLLAALLETYIEARNVGWETVALDALAEKIRRAMT